MKILSSLSVRWMYICIWACHVHGPPATTRWPESWSHRSTPKRRQSTERLVAASFASDTRTDRWWPNTDPTISRTNSICWPCWREHRVNAIYHTNPCRRTMYYRGLRRVRKMALPPNPPNSQLRLDSLRINLLTLCVAVRKKSREFRRRSGKNDKTTSPCYCYRPIF